jgi:hypothetical protein
MGRIWNENGKIAANFSWGGHEYRNNIGSIQVLFEMDERVRGFDYKVTILFSPTCKTLPV